MAYIDPGSGSALMSAIFGGFVAFFLVIKTYWYKFKALITGKKTNTGKEEKKQSDEDTENTE